MSDKQHKSAPGADLLGPILFIVGSFTALLVIGALGVGTPKQGAGGTGAIARAVVLTLGAVPALLLALGMSVLGVRVFLGGSLKGVLRHLSGLAGTAAGLAFLLGSLTETAGGAIGAATGGALASVLTSAPAFFFGLAAVVAPVWFTWLRDLEFLPSRLPAGKKQGLAPPPDAFGSTAPLLNSAQTAVSAAEADALLPDPQITSQQRAVSQALQEEEQPSWIALDESIHPYPEDARLKGEIPSGAQPLEEGVATVAKDPAPEQEPGQALDSGTRWTPARDERGEVAQAQEAATPTAATLDVPAAPQEAEVLEYDESVPTPRWESAVEGIEQKVAVLEESVEAQQEPESASPAPANASLWRPSVEALTEPLEDLLATPDTLDEEIPEEQEDLLPPLAEESQVPCAAAPKGDKEPGEDEEPEEDWEYVEVAEGEEGWEDAEEEEESDEEEEWEYVEVAEGEEGWQEAPAAAPEQVAPLVALSGAGELETEVDEQPDTDELDESDEDEWEYVEVCEGEDGWEEAEEAPELDPLTAPLAQDLEPAVVSQPPNGEELYEQEFADLLAAEQPTSEPVEPAVELPAELEVASVLEAVPEAPTIAAPSPPADQLQMDLFADPEPAPEAQTEDSPELAEDPEASSEPIVVLTPQATHASAGALQAAEVILKEQRVAVSILQRACDLDFKQSCTILDELQELGFIGPYVDGNSRDILMGREEWLSTVGME